MNLRQLEYFVRVAELGSFSKAALVLDIAQPALSRQVRLLETELHVTLLTRNGRGVALTEIGKKLFDQGIGILQLVDRVSEELGEARNEPVGQVIVGLPPSYGRLLTLPLVKAFQQRFPKARLSIVEGLSAHLTEWIATGRVDLGLLHAPASNVGLDITPVSKERLGLVTRADGDDTESAPIRLADIAGYQLIVPERAHFLRRLLETQIALGGLRLDVSLEVSSVQSILELVGAGYGAAVLTRSALRASGRPADFSFRPITDPELTSSLCLAYSSNKQQTPLVKLTVALLQELMADFRP
ncbi:LysR family transcriptional regulator [Azoarcus sp. L1K30]|uniref:LysR family transcriptional regulator n=1 Tax=Azoarcus sp. L1K30 TaxID=2820277 RepID=UPI001B83A17E|nr:LysR family transcriptional regulator [Azoarcus sp. L1K30]MBR0564751.1 LysR family transcriptional regulator [Azoarcus sp. L1K30]